MEDRTEIVNGLIVTDAARTINAWNSLCDEEKERKIQRARDLGFF